MRIDTWSPDVTVYADIDGGFPLVVYDSVHTAHAYRFYVPMAGMTVSRWAWSNLTSSPDSIIFTRAVNWSSTASTTPF